MKYVILLYMFGCLLLATSCTIDSRKREIRNSLNREVKFSMFNCVSQKRKSVLLEDVWSEYDFLSVVYLKEGCSPCYPKFLDWHTKMGVLDSIGNHTVLFVIDGQRYSDFLTKVLDLGYVEDRYYTVMDTDSKFLEANKDISRWILDASVLIDAENKIKMVGAPWLNEEMTELFNSIVY
ncbi:MAG TPA: hypothetical protein VKY45_10095, partial [Marinilabiliaceae bacterium]|nr:hypothetical protein [Marinilabiliaceae bacterium]